MDHPFGFSDFPFDFLNPVILKESPQLTDELDFNVVLILMRWAFTWICSVSG
ncbi:MAG: hypothetical protein K2G55_19060 [Lachnospiraceae bacterium]|nr:hypothetical protein [Lachnospiraceae bacterium]MDE7200529.1 hypothetical protein [Lachnospiraceae bacterium]